MKGETIVAKRYARALLETAREAGQVAPIGDDLKAAVSAIADNVDFGRLLSHPNVDLKTKLQLLEQAFQGKVADSVLRTLQLIVERGRAAILGDLVTEYWNIANEALGQAEAVVTTPVPLTEKEAEEIRDRFGKLTGKTIKIENVVDPHILGGVRVRIGDRLYDGSLSGKLERLRKELGVHQAL